MFHPKDIQLTPRWPVVELSLLKALIEPSPAVDSPAQANTAPGPLAVSPLSQSSPWFAGSRGRGRGRGSRGSRGARGGCGRGNNGADRGGATVTSGYLGL